MNWDYQACGMHACPQLLWYDHLNHWEVMLRSKTIYFFWGGGDDFGGFLGKDFEIILWNPSSLTHCSTREKGKGLFVWEPMHRGLHFQPTNF